MHCLLHFFSFRHVGEDGGDGDGCELEASSTGSHCGGHATRWLTSAAPVDILELLLLATRRVPQGTVANMD